MNNPYVHQTHSADQLSARLSVAILAGGASRRFGADKAMFQLCSDNRTLLEMVAVTGKKIVDEVFVVGHARYAHVVPDLRVVPDNRPGAGPLAGIQTALEFASTSDVLVLACDMPCLSVALLKWMAASTSACDVSIPRTRDGRWQPMPAIYRRTALPAIRACLDSGRFSVSSLLELISIEELQETELRRFDPALDSLFSLNRFEQLERAVHCASCN